MERLAPHDDLQAGARWAPALRALPDERLARMVESGSDSAFAAIYGRYTPILHGYCRSLLRDDDEAGDALQNAMLKALQAMRRAGRTGPLRPWLFRIAHNESITIIRQRTRRPGPLDESMVAGADDAFRRAVAREQLAALLEDLEHLTEQQRGALVMRELGGLSYDEIGSALETTPLAARQAVFVARRRLRDGAVAPRRLRPALRQLIPPAPGLALFGLFGGGSAFSAGKVVIGTAAAVSVGVGTVEIAHEPPAPVKREAVVAAKPKAKPRKAITRAAPARTAAPAATATPAAAKTVKLVRVAATVAPVKRATFVKGSDEGVEEETAAPVQARESHPRPIEREHGTRPERRPVESEDDGEFTEPAPPVRERPAAERPEEETVAYVPPVRDEGRHSFGRAEGERPPREDCPEPTPPPTQ